MPRHVPESDLALHAGNDLGWFASWRVNRHLAVCAECRRTETGYRELGEELSGAGDPPVADWDRLAVEMQANIRLGLAAGECVAQRHVAPGPAWRTLLAYASVLVLVVAGLLFQRRNPEPPVTPVEEPKEERLVFAAINNGIELKQGSHAMGLMHRGGREVTVSVSAQGAVGARYVDSSTGHVVIHSVLAE